MDTVQQLSISILGFVVPGLCIIGARPVFECRRQRTVFIVALTFAAIMGLSLILSGGSIPRLGTALLIPLFQFGGYYLLKRMFYGAYDWKPEFVMFDYRKDAGTSKDRMFLGTFVGASLFLGAILLS